MMLEYDVERLYAEKARREQAREDNRKDQPVFVRKASPGTPVKLPPRRIASKTGRR